ncbi:MAG: aminotransferase class V-fold PLP-dependent enzyme [Saprospiraceae bacterium]
MNITQIRKDTPGTQRLIHFNNAGASLPTRHVLEAVQDFMHREAMTGGYRFMAEEADAINEFYTQAAQLINASPDEIALTQNASSSLNLALYALPWEKDDVILTSEIEYGNNYLNYLKLEKDKGVKIRIFPLNENYHYDLNTFENYIDDKVKLIAITHIPTNNGMIAPVEAIGKIAKKHNILYMIDACQSIGHLPFDVEKIGCDFSTATSRKYLRGPRGMGFLYVRKPIIERMNPVFLEMLYADWQSETDFQLNKSIKMFECWEKPYALIAGFTAAIRYANDVGMDNIWQRTEEIAIYLRQKLQTVKGITIQDIGKNLCGIVTFTMEGTTPEILKKHLHQFNINTSVSGRFSSVIDMDKRGLSDVLRVSVHYYNTKEEVNKLINCLM